jgi:hypothetical protein
MQDTSQGPHHGDNKKLRIILWILICLAGSEFIVRGPVRFLLIPSNWNDLSQNYTASKLWLNGLSPSDPRNFVVLWKHETGARLELTDIRTHLAPPLGGLVVLAPIAVFPFRVAKILWLIVLLISFAGSVWALLLAGGFRRDELRTLAFVGASLALAPFQTGIASGNTSIFVIGLCAVAILAAIRSRDVAAGVLFGLACSLKPQIGAFLVLYYLVRRRWQLFGTAVGTTTGLTLGAALYLQLRGAPWIYDYLHNAQGFVTANHLDDFSTVNPSRFTLINLQVPFFSITGQSSSANLLAFAVTGFLLCIWLYWVVRSPERELELLSLGAISVLALLPVYHRFYDAALVIVPLCWCMTMKGGRSSGRPKMIVQIVLLLMTLFLVPGAALLQELAIGGHFSDTVTHSWLWNCVVMPHETWTLLALCLVLLYGIRSALPSKRSEAARAGSI